MRILLYEYLTASAGSFLEAESETVDSMLREGAAMLSALAEDCSALPNVEPILICSPLNNRFDFPRCQVVPTNHVDERNQLQHVAIECDAAIIIAPECDGILVDCIRALNSTGTKLVSPDVHFAEIAGDKQATCQRLKDHGVKTPSGLLIYSGSESPHEFSFPAVAKPCDGAGSHGVRKLDSRTEAKEYFESIDSDGLPVRMETFCEGIPASVSFLCGPTGSNPLEPTQQLLSADGLFTYLGGKLPLDPLLRQRAVTLANKAVNALPRTVGYVGVDLVLGHAENGNDDVVIEINPRLTTSYLGLRRLCHQNLAKAMLAVATGENVELSFGTDPIEFKP